MIDASVLHEYKEALKKELQKAADGAESCFSFIKHDLNTTSHLYENNLVQIFVIGGSIGKIALVKVQKDTIEILHTKTITLNQFQTKDELLFYIKKYINLDISHLVINFAHPLLPTTRDGKIDGILLSTSKNHSFEGLSDSLIGEVVEDFIKNTFAKVIPVSVINDVIAQLISGLSINTSYDLIAGIIGTGLNFAFYETPDVAINLEASRFTYCLRDVKNIQNKIDLIGKKISGAYLYKYFNEYVEKNNLSFKEISSTKELDDIADGNIPQISFVAKELLSQSAQLTAVLICAITEYKKINTTCIMQGSLYLKGKLYKETLHQTIENIKNQYQPTLISISESDIVGGAFLLLNKN